MSVHANSSLAELIASLPEEDQKTILDLPEAEAKRVLYDWSVWARPNQLPPPGDWTYWLLLAGRGFGKTRVGAEWVRKRSEDSEIIHLIAPTASDIRKVMVEGPSGILSCFPRDERPLYEPSKGHKITFVSGTVAYGFSADEPDRLRGPQCHAMWCDEMASWPSGKDEMGRPTECPAWDMAQFGLRLGEHPQAVITTTPKPLPHIRALLKHPSCVITRGSTYDNRRNLAPSFYTDIIRKYEGTRLGRQELMAEVLTDIPGALWTQAMIDACRVDLAQLPKCVRVIVAIDPAVTAGEDSDETGMIVAGIDNRQHIYVIADGSARSSPRDWAYAACRLFLKWDCDRIVAEVNNGGDLVEANIRGVHPAIPYRAVRASRGKYVRAEPVAALYEQGRVHHVGCFPDLEEQMCGFVPGLEAKSPDRMDALVWAVYDLLLQPLEMTMLTYDSGYSISPI